VVDVPWTQLIGLRNRLVHDYGRIDRDILWDTLQVDIPSLIDQLERLVQSDQSE
jgi:uncharacterized protein with HEPN domain